MNTSGRMKWFVCLVIRASVCDAAEHALPIAIVRIPLLSVVEYEKACGAIIEPMSLMVSAKLGYEMRLGTAVPADDFCAGAAEDTV